MEVQAWDYATEEGLGEVLDTIKDAYWEEELLEAPAPYVRVGHTWLKRVTLPIEEAWGDAGYAMQGTGIEPLGQAIYNDLAQETSGV